MMKQMNMDDRLACGRFDSHDSCPHVTIDRVACGTCTHKACTYSCPAGRYVWDEENKIMEFGHLGCLECGNCRLVCERLRNGEEGYSWNYPDQGYGFVAKEG